MDFIFDLDGTICFHGQPISTKILDCLLELEHAGHSIGFASARPCRDMLPVLDERFAKHLLIGANGAMTYHHGSLRSCVPLQRPLAKEIITLLDEYHATYLVDDKWDYGFNCPTSHPFLMNIDGNRLANQVDIDRIQSILKILVLSCDQLDVLSAKLKNLDVTLHYHSAEGILDITYKGVNKWTALQQWGIQEDQMVCFGNDLNDLPMFQKAYYSVLIGKCEPLQAFARKNIAFDDQIEQNMIATLQELCLRFAKVK
ncbi:hydrolase [Brevibacillus sp. SKDU10]|uniref:HAD-IIB family hydrolase n=1 Tax=Brevibacillus sp. SKDU10 TaxID=1247872 RepID=UPI0007C90189|nr:HAD family hydrolase [Brevibacillus sp. SKDU10]OAJ76193.1 hydrolase [Brevibacillus sp. SKDU10]